MERQKVLFTWLQSEWAQKLPRPHYSTAGSAGMDVAAALSETVTLPPGDILLIPCGFAVAIPSGYEMQVRPRSGLAVKKGVTIINAPGTIDADYRGEVKVGLINLGKEPYVIQPGERIAQLVLSPVVQAELEVVYQLDSTERGIGGFGHTGTK